MAREGGVARALGTAMHPLTFEVKRIHWRATWEAIGLYRAAAVVWKEPTLADMTPARCDILQCVWDNEEERRAERQAAGKVPGGSKMPLAELRKTLGLAGSTVWKCVKRLVELEWVTLGNDEKKKRRVIVLLTELGIHALRMAQKCAVTSFVDENRQPRACMTGRIAHFVARDAERQERVGQPGEVATSAPDPSPRERPTSWVATRPTPRMRRSFGCWTDYFWWLVEHGRGLAQYFGSRAGRMRRWVVGEDDDTWFPIEDDDDVSR